MLEQILYKQKKFLILLVPLLAMNPTQGMEKETTQKNSHGAQRLDDDFDFDMFWNAIDKTIEHVKPTKIEDKIKESPTQILFRSTCSSMSEEAKQAKNLYLEGKRIFFECYKSKSYFESIRLTYSTFKIAADRGNPSALYVMGTAHLIHATNPIRSNFTACFLNNKNYTVKEHLELASHYFTLGLDNISFTNKCIEHWIDLDFGYNIMINSGGMSNLASCLFEMRLYLVIKLMKING